MNHGLIRPLQQQWCDGVILPVNDQHQGGCILSPGSKVKQAPLLYCGEMVQRLSQLFTCLTVPLIPAPSSTNCGCAD